MGVNNIGGAGYTYTPSIEFDANRKLSDCFFELLEGLKPGEKINISGIILEKTAEGNITLTTNGATSSKHLTEAEITQIRAAKTGVPTLKALCEALVNSPDLNPLKQAMAKLDKAYTDRGKPLDQAGLQVFFDTLLASDPQNPDAAADAAIRTLPPSKPAASIPAVDEGTLPAAGGGDGTAAAKQEAMTRFLALQGIEGKRITYVDSDKDEKTFNIQIDGKDIQVGSKSVDLNTIEIEELAAMGINVPAKLFAAMTKGLLSLKGDGSISLEDLNNCLETVKWYSNKMGISQTQAWALYQGGLMEVSQAAFEKDYNATCAGLSKDPTLAKQPEETYVSWVARTPEKYQQALRNYLKSEAGFNPDDKLTDATYAKLIQKLIALAYASQLDPAARETAFGIKATSSLPKFNGALKTGDIVAWLKGEAMPAASGKIVPARTEKSP
ncbi:MAG: hypothetical protein NT099_06940 [Candidatus Saganbacteria bacterium]|nr:hypothetical protein [Candidatus Saganbacteria bacterium]